jgi:hypothetical protein
MHNLTIELVEVIRRDRMREAELARRASMVTSKGPRRIRLRLLPSWRRRATRQIRPTGAT